MKALPAWIAALLIIGGAYTCCSAFEVDVYPKDPGGGEGILVRITGEPRDDYRVTFNGKTHIPFAASGRASELFLPLGIEERGQKVLTVTRLSGPMDEAKNVVITVRGRVKAAVQLRASDEGMRDKQPMVETQNTLVLDTLRSLSSERRWGGGFILPLTHPISTRFAVHRQGKTYSYYHKGLDFSAPSGTVVKAMNDGTVILSEKDLNVYGNTLIVDHGQGVVTCYFHLSRLLKFAGDTVNKGEPIAKVGASGWATGPHLHMGVYLQGQAVDPLWWVRFTREISVDGDAAGDAFNRKL